MGEGEYQAGYAAGRRLRADHVRRTPLRRPRGRQRRARAALPRLGRRAGARESVLDVNLQHTAVAERPGHRAAVGSTRYSRSARWSQGRPSKRPEAIILSGRVTYGTSGLTPQVLNAVRAGQIAFAIDRQEYLQGYLPIVLLTQYHLYGVLPDRGKLISTGPVFITRQNAAHVLKLSNQGCAVRPMPTLALQEERALISAAPRARDPTAPPWRGSRAHRMV